MHIHICIYIYTYIYTYIYIYTYTQIYIYIYIYRANPRCTGNYTQIKPHLLDVVGKEELVDIALVDGAGVGKCLPVDHLLPVLDAEENHLNRSEVKHRVGVVRHGSKE